VLNSVPISVVIPAYRRERYVLDAVRSVLVSNIDRSRYEILLVTDGVRPELERQLRELGVSVHTTGAPTIGDMLATGVSAARGEVVAFLDDDDCFHPAKLREVTEVFADPKVVFFHHGWRRVDGGRRPLDAPAEFTRAQIRVSLPARRGAIGRLRRMGGLCNTSSIVVRRSALLPQLSTLRKVTNAQDFSLFLLLGGPGEALIDGTRVLVDYRTHVSQGTQLLHGDTLPPDHLRFLEGTVRSFEWVRHAAPTAGARKFARCREESYETLLWTITGRTLVSHRSPGFEAIRAILGNLREQDVRNAAILAFLVFLSAFSHRWALRFYLPLKRVELASLGLSTAPAAAGAPSPG
jgi:hypothetical protein